MQPIQWKKLAGVYEAIIAAGHNIMHTQDGSYADDAAAVQAIIDAYDPLPFLRADLHATVAAERVRRQLQGAPYVFPDGVAGTVQTRDAQDLLNINGIATRAMMRAMTGDTSAVIAFRDHQDRMHDLTVAEVSALAVAVGEFVEALYQAKWDHDTAIDAWDGSAPYDIATGWPG